MPTNQEYFQRWEESAPTAVDSGMTPEEIQALQGTRLQDKPSWQSYDDELTPEITDQALADAVAEYAMNVHDSQGSEQNREELAMRKEWNDAAAEEYRWLRPEEYADQGARIGHIIHSSVFINDLRKAGVKCWYRNHPQAGKITLVVQKGNEPPKVGCWVQLGFMPELSIMNFDDHGVPLAERFRGWRTCLLQLILHGVIGEKTADATFGKPAVTEAFNRYNSTLRSFRNQERRLAK
jgi:hypothetical protein